MGQGWYRFQFKENSFLRNYCTIPTVTTTLI